MPTRGTADYFNICAEGRAGVPKNFMGYSFPREGVAYAGLILLFEPAPANSRIKPENYREYLQGILTKEMVKDKIYEISIYYAVSSYSTFAVNRIGVYLSAKKTGLQPNAGVLNYKPQIETDSLKTENEHYVWFNLKGKYTSKGGERFITIGNFYDDYQTKYVLCDFSDLSSVKKASVVKDQLAYYYFDNISVVEYTGN